MSHKSDRFAARQGGSFRATGVQRIQDETNRLSIEVRSILPSASKPPSRPRIIQRRSLHDARIEIKPVDPSEFEDTCLPKEDYHGSMCECWKKRLR